MNKLICIRHGQTDWNIAGKMQGRTDIELNETGKMQAEEVSKKINLDEIDLCLCSPLKRTSQTAQIITKGKLDIIYDDMLVERSFGDLEGTVAKKEIMDRHWDYKLNTNENGIESIQDCIYRTKEFLDKINDLYDNKTILIVSHGCFIKLLHFNLVGYDENTDFYSFFPKNGEIYTYELQKTRKIGR